MHALNRASAATLAIAAAIAVLPTGPSAASVLITGSGAFDVTAPTTAISAPGETFSFSFELPNPISANPTTEGTDFSFDLGGSPVADGLAEVEFFTTASSGPFRYRFRQRRPPQHLRGGCGLFADHQHGRLPRHGRLERRPRSRGGNGDDLLGARTRRLGAHAHRRRRSRIVATRSTRAGLGGFRLTPPIGRPRLQWKNACNAGGIVSSHTPRRE